MRIVLIRNLNPFFDSSASGNRFSSLVLGLSKLGVNVTLLVTGGYNSLEEKKILLSRCINNNISVIYVVKAKNTNIWWRRFNRYILPVFGEKMIISHINKYISSIKGKVDYVWLTNDNIIFKSALDCNFNGIPMVLEMNEFHDIYKIEGKAVNKIQLKYASDNEKLFWKVVKRVDYFAFMTKTLMNYYRSKINPSAKIFHLPMTVDMERFHMPKNINVSEKYIAFAGSFDNRKDGLNILIESFAKIHTKYPEYRLKIAGFYHPDVENQKRIISENGLQEKVEYVGTLNRDQIPQFLVDASVLALSRPDSHQAQGGFPTKLGEYLSTKNPVCVTRVGEIPEYLTDGENAFLAEPGNVESFAVALERAILDSRYGCKVGMAGYEVAKANFNIDVQAKRFYDFLLSNKK